MEIGTREFVDFLPQLVWLTDDSGGYDIELTYNHGVDSYELGTGYGHIAVSVDDIDATLDQIDSTIQFGEVANLFLGLPEPGSSFVRYSFDLVPG